MRNFFLRLQKMQYGSRDVGAGDAPLPQILTDQLTPFKPRGTDYAPSPLEFSYLPTALGRADEGNLRELI